MSTHPDTYGAIYAHTGDCENLDDHCEQCFNEDVCYFVFRDKPYNNLTGIVGYKKYLHFKDNLDKIFLGLEIIEQVV